MWLRQKKPHNIKSGIKKSSNIFIENQLVNKRYGCTVFKHTQTTLTKRMQPQ